nr:hypothetical protein [Bacillus paranthracis]
LVTVNRPTNKKYNLGKHNQSISPGFCVTFTFELPTKLELHKKKWTNLYQVSPFFSVLINSKSPSFFALLLSSLKEGVIRLPTKILFTVFD